MSTLPTQADAFTKTRLGIEERAHARRVAALVQARGGDDVAVAAAMLHDVLEDTPTLLAELVSVFGLEVATLVMALTDHYTPKGYPSLKRAARKKLEAERLAEMARADDRVRLIKCADIEDNDARIESKGAEFARIWRREKAYLLQCLKE